MKIVAISGPSCSGKSTISQNLVRLVPGSIIVHQDDFYLPDSQIPQTEDGVANWDCPEAFEMDRFAKVVADLRHGKKTEYKTYENAQVEHIEALAPQLEPLAIVEGIMLYQKCSPLLGEFDVMLFVNEDKDTLKMRRETRTYDTVEGEWADPPGYFDKVVWPEFEKNYGYLIDNSCSTSQPSQAARDLGIDFVPTGSLKEMFDHVTQTLKDAQL